MCGLATWPRQPHHRRVTTRDPEHAWLEVAGSVLAQVRHALGFEMAVLSRRSGDSYLVLGADDDVYGVRAGDVLPWEDTLCARMADGRAPRVAPDARAVPAYAEAGAVLGMDVGAYVSLPLRDETGALLGTLCAATPHRRTDELLLHQALLEVLAETLAALLASELRSQREARRAERAETAAQVDPLTGIGNRRLWDLRLAAEERRCASYGLPAALIAVDVDGLKELNDSLGHEAGDALLRAVAAALVATTGPDDVIARTGGDEFSVLLPESGADRVDAVVVTLRTAFADRGVSAGIGTGVRAGGGLCAAWREADAALLTDKRRRRPRAVRVPAPRVDGSADDVLLQELLELARRQLGAVISFVGEWRGGASGVRVMRGVSSAVPVPVGRGATEPLDGTLCQRILDGRLPRVIPDTSREPEAMALPITSALPIGSYVGVPVVLSDGQLYGTLCCLSPTPDLGLSDRDADFLAGIADSMARVLEAELKQQAARNSLVARLDPVLRGRGLHVVYQPVVALGDGGRTGVEALARFGADGTGAPGPWFDDARAAGVTGELELAAATMALASAPATDGFLALNFSATTICSPGFSRLLEPHDPTGLVVEVSEHEQIADYAVVLEALRPWRRQGLRVAVDDAGAGFASLRHVVLLAPDLIKLDLSLVRGIDADPTRQALAAALTTFARSAGAQVVAEGVETVQERDVLAASGVTLGQGWLFGAGVPADRLAAVPAPRSALASARPAGRRRTPASRRP